VASHRTIHIRLLGEFDVRRSDGTDVEQHEWRTSKTRDLLRLLALANGHPVLVASLTDKLWPEATPSRARSSLGTAASQIRSTLGEHCVVRRSDALLLDSAWVDVNAFKALAHVAQLAARRGASAEVLTSARAALFLYRGDFHAHDDDSAWAVGERVLLRRLHMETLCDGAQAAHELGHVREAVELASTAVGLDPTVEAAYRTLMLSHAELGEVGMALRAYEACRAHLADELGVDPSPRTQRLYLQILRRPDDLRSGPAFGLRDSG
jgi:DNA-binding SARP family transcriptional activator